LFVVAAIGTVTISFSRAPSRVTKAVKIFAVLAGGRGRSLFFAHNIFSVGISISKAAFATICHSAPMAGCEKKNTPKTGNNTRMMVPQRKLSLRKLSLGLNATSVFKKVNLIGGRLKSESFSLM